MIRVLAATGSPCMRRSRAPGILRSGNLFPGIVSANNGTDNAGNTQAATVQLPANIVSGNLLLIFGRFFAAVTGLASANWTVLYSAGANQIVACLYKIADGTEGATASLTWTTATANHWYAVQVGNWLGSGAPEAGTTASGSSTAPAPPSLTPSWGAGSTLWFAHASTTTAGGPFTAFPANYTNSQYSVTQLAIASRKLAASPEQPGVLAITNSAAWSANTVAVRGRG